MRRIVLVSGAPGAGKSTLARPLAAALGMPLLSKDVIKESLADSLGPRDDLMAWSRALGGASMELIWKLAAQSPAAVLEANFRPHSTYEHEKLAGLGAQIVEVHCACPPDEAARRYNARGATAQQHAIHALRELTPDLLAEFDRPMSVGELIVIDTTIQTDIRALAGRVLNAFHKSS